MKAVKLLQYIREQGSVKVLKKGTNYPSCLKLQAQGKISITEVLGSEYVIVKEIK
jgi:hypothetical protein